jgi:hypothetical protein
MHSNDFANFASGLIGGLQAHFRKKTMHYRSKKDYRKKFEAKKMVKAEILNKKSSKG